METIASALLAWLIAKTGLAAPDVPPIMLVPKHRLVEIAYGANPPPLAAVSGLYDTKTSTIYLLDNWDGSQLLDRSELVHELVHHLQNVNKVPAPCFAAHERQAIHLQLEWLREQGVKDPYEFLNINELYVLLVSGCRDSDR